MFSGFPASLKQRGTTLGFVQFQALVVSKDETRPEMVSNIFETIRGPETLPRTMISFTEVGLK